MKLTIVILTLLLCSVSAQADEFDAGVCYNSGGGYGVRPRGESLCYRVYFEDAEAEADFDNLMPGDSIAFTGTLINSSVINIESISTISLFRLLGGWKDSKNRYYNFSSYDNLVIYDPGSPYVVKTESFSYELYPNSSQRWGIAMTSKKSNRVGLLRQFIDKTGVFHFEICLYQDNLPARKRVCSTLNRLTN